MPAAQLAKLKTYVDACHAGGQRVRFHATPDLALPARDRLWAQLLAAGVGWLNTDDLTGLRRFLLAHPNA